ncbi:MAG: excinuclease ABC subunit UvrA [Kiritimatiellia bacterium]
MSGSTSAAQSKPKPAKSGKRSSVSAPGALRLPRGAEAICVRGARQNNLKNIDVTIPVGKLTVVTGLSGSGKSSLVFDTVYAEGQRRYIETFSSYARQFLERLPPPAVDSVEGIPPAIAIRQQNSVRNFRSTVGTMTEMQDYLKTLFATCARLYCPDCGREIVRDTPETVFADLLRRGLSGKQLCIVFSVDLPETVSYGDVVALLSQQGYARIFPDPEDPPKAATTEAPAKKKAGKKKASRKESVSDVARTNGKLCVLLDTVVLREEKKSRIFESLEKAFDAGYGHLAVYAAPARAADGTRPMPSELLARYSSRLECPDCHHGFEAPVPNHFSFNSPIGACPECHGFGRVIGISGQLVIPDPSKSLSEGCIKPFTTEANRECQRMLLRRCKELGYDTECPWEKLPREVREWVWHGETKSWRSHKWPGIDAFFEWLESRTYKLHVRVMLARYREYTLCKTCSGTRLRAESLAWRLVAPDGKWHTIATLCAEPIDSALAFLTQIYEAAPAGTPTGDAARTLLTEILSRLRYLVEVGVGYLTLDRPSRTLSGGEAQRIALTTALGSHLVGTLFVLDEPSIGLHPRDIDRLIGILRKLCAAGNTLLVVEHDPAVILAADHVIELGPGSGERGGGIVCAGTVGDLLACAGSPSAPYLLQEHALQARKTRGEEKPEEKNSPRLRLIGATAHNLHDVSVDIPLQKFVVVTGVSGSGKSTLVCDILHPALRRKVGLPPVPGLIPGELRRLEGADGIGTVALVDQSPIGKSSRSTPANYLGIFDAIRAVYAALPEAKARGFGISDFSFNSGTGRCPDCEGTGFEHIEMQFLSDVYLPCETCGGTRYRPEILTVTYQWRKRALTISDVLQLTGEEAAQVFADHPMVLRRLQPLLDVGLGYLRLGQAVPTLSGGEAQRLKLAGFLAGIHPDASATGGKTKGVHSSGSLLIFDEPTTGLHFSDIETLLGIFRRLVANGHSVLVIEHNLQVIRAADYLIDLGPDGGEQGGRIVATGAPSAFLQSGMPGATAAALRGEGAGAL